VIGVAVVGAGMAGQGHAHGYRSAGIHPTVAATGVDLVAVVDPDLGRAHDVAARYGYRHALPDVDELVGGPVARGEVQAASVAVPNDRCAEVASRLLAAGVHVLAEKPLGRDADEAWSLVTAAEAAGVLGGVGLTWRHLPAVDAAARLVREGAIGDVRHATGWYHSSYASSPLTPLTWRYDRARAGGGAILDVGAHLVGVLDHVTGPVRRVVAAHQSTLIPARPLPADATSGHFGTGVSGDAAVTTDDVTTALAELDGGAVVELSVSRVALGVPNELGFRVYGSRGSVFFDASRPDGFGLFLEDAAPYQVNGVRRVVAGPHHDPFGRSVAMPAQGLGSGFDAAFTAQAQDFLLAVAGVAPLAADLRAGHRVMQVCDAVQRAAATGTPVEVVPPGTW
jgi:predicted dehydrogenase